MRRVAANVIVSFFIDRNAAQHTAARALMQSAEDGEIVAVVPQAVVFARTRCDAVATFDRKLANKLQTFGLAAYF